ncbi:DUF4868 domain-containing protein [Candidatus Saccharibacteria bacterium]|nr:DUF4868 domain-containing protein [Candidatus Saccharibacteria bacterium]
MTDQPEPTDVFLWANQTDRIKNEISLELFVFNKNYTPYHIKYSAELENQLRAMFLYDAINTVNFGAGTGMMVRDYERSEAEENVLLRTEVAKVGRAETLLHLIEKERASIESFSETDHEFKRVKGVVLRCKEADAAPFYIVKAVQQSNVLAGATSWELNGGTLAPFKADIGVKMPTDNQVVIIGGDIFIFHQSKFEKLFQHEYKKQLLADEKVAEIEKTYKLSFAEGLDLQTLVRERRKVVNKLQKLEIGAVSQEQAIEYADEMQLELMSDEKNQIIIMDGNDLDMFVNLINEDYITSQVTGRRYEIKSKKLLGEPDGEAPRG